MALGDEIYEEQRQRAKREVGSQVQGQKEAMQRRFAAQGSLNSGAAIKQAQLAEEAGAQRLDNVSQQINAAQAQQKYQELEAQKGRDFTAGEAGKQREFLTGERLGGEKFSAEQGNLARLFQSNEANKQRDFARGERLGSEAFSARQADIARELQKSQFAKQMEFAGQQFDEEKYINRENLKIAQQIANEKDFLERMFEQYMGGSGGGGAGGAFGKIGQYSPGIQIAKRSGLGGGIF